MAREWTSIDALRMDKFMRLVRNYVNAAFCYLIQRSWDSELMAAYLELVEAIPLSVANMKVSDGLRYHVLDVWVEELDRADEMRNEGKDGECPIEIIMGPVKRLEKNGKSKTVRERAAECAGDERLKDWSKSGADAPTNDAVGNTNEDTNDEEWDGLDE
ncbi:hypothetical protein MMC19_001749 [Ptychographa xylographoides]|nr:hypothetical protein [Ptychographa xylographoides]